ncbi:MAG TPA: ATP-binding protein [Kofleriaceae bacterium]|nr:ATP-binding protein [Kofleriaceae bacterium]
MSKPPGRVTQIRGLTEVSRALTTAASFDEVLQLVVERAAPMFATPTSLLMLADEDGQLTVRAAVGLEVGAQRVRHPLDETLIEELQGTLAAELQEALGVGPERLLGVPLVVNGRVTGLLAVGLSEAAPPPGDEEEWLLSALADQASVAIEKTRLDERGQLRDRLIGIVSHDLRNPINTIMLGASALLGLETLDPYAKKTVTRIMSAAGRAGRLVSDLLDYTQASLGGGIHVQHGPAVLGTIVRGVVDELAATDRCFEVIEIGDTTAQLDADRIAQVVGNLLSNAVSYREPGTAIQIAIGGDEGWVTMAVHNTGPVIPTERMADIFQPMTQLTLGTGRAERSVGLGLYIVEAIVTAHAGTIAVTSTITEGTTFAVRLPRLRSTRTT